MKLDPARLIRAIRHAGTLFGCALIFTVAACGGGGDDGDTAATPATTPDPIAARLRALGTGPAVSAAAASTAVPAAAGPVQDGPGIPANSTTPTPQPGVRDLT